MTAIPSRVKDLTGRRFGRLVVTRFVETRKYSGASAARWECLCECGKQTVVFANSLASGRQVSCGCHKNEILTERMLRHGMGYSIENRIWRGMLGRCRNPKDTGYRLYGGRGIEVRYRDFEDFYSDLGPRPSPAHSVDRIESNGHYERGNCRWATPETQANNTSRNRKIEGKTVAEWARETGATYGTIHGRLQRGWDDADAISEPVKSQQRQFVTIDGQTKCVAEWARVRGISEFTIYRRIRNGWPPERAVTEKVRQWPSKTKS